jgi:hypothetical protein
MEVSMKRDAASEKFASEIEDAHKALLDKVQEDPEREWFAYELKDRVRNGWSAGAMNMALTRLIDSGTFKLEGDRIRLRR